MHRTNYNAANLDFNHRLLSRAALEVATTLQDAGFDGYLVGGCVRDLLLRKTPKDFDVATNATPEQIKTLFRRARIIGRRFRLVHVRAGREIVEVATYRAPQSAAKKYHFGVGSVRTTHSGRVLEDNVFGSLEQDAVRRDFTINALYYDPHKRQVVDFVGGVRDAQNNQLRIIGDARERFIEDPVRLLRALRFHAKLNLTLSDSLQQRISEGVNLLDDVPAPRLFDEIIKMFHHGHALKSWQVMRRYGVVDRLFPLSATHFAKHPRGEELVQSAMHNTDQRVAEGKPVIPAFLFAVLLWLPFCEQLARQQRRGVPLPEAIWRSGEKLFSQQGARAQVPRRVSTVAVEMWEMQFALAQRKPRRIDSILANRRFRAGYDFLLLRQQIGEVESELTNWWGAIQEQPSEGKNRMIDALRASSPKTKRRPKHRRR